MTYESLPQYSEPIDSEGICERLFADHGTFHPLFRSESSSNPAPAQPDSIDNGMESPPSLVRDCKPAQEEVPWWKSLCNKMKRSWARFTKMFNLVKLEHSEASKKPKSTSVAAFNYWVSRRLHEQGEASENSNNASVAAFNYWVSRQLNHSPRSSSEE